MAGVSGGWEILPERGGGKFYIVAIVLKAGDRGTSFVGKTPEEAIRAAREACESALRQLSQPEKL